MDSRTIDSVNALADANRRLLESVRIKDAELDVLRHQVKVLSGEVLKCRQDGSYAEQAAATFSPAT